MYNNHDVWDHKVRYQGAGFTRYLNVHMFNNHDKTCKYVVPETPKKLKNKTTICCLASSAISNACYNLLYMKN